MEYIKNEDHEYILNKYHDTKKPFDPLKRFVRNDAIFSAGTGMDADRIREEILRRDAQIADRSHPIRMAHAFACVLENTRISCDKRDIFPAINAIDRPLNATVIQLWKNEVFGTLVPQVEAQRLQLARDGAATIWPDYSHSVPVWDRLLSLGFAGLLAESEAARRGSERTPEQTAFYEGVRITYEAVMDLIGKLADLAGKTEGSERMAIALRNIQHNPPATFYEGLLTVYLYFMLSEHVGGMQARSLSNFDRLFYKYYISDLEKGVTEAQIRKDLAYFFLQFTAIGNYWNQPVFLGGCKADETTEINDLSYLFLDVYDKMGLYNPKIQIKVADSTPKDFILKALDMIRRGKNSIVFVSDATIRKALEKAGVSKEAARLANVKGCYEYAPQGSMNTEMTYFNLLKPLEYAMHQGCDGLSGTFYGRKSPACREYRSFEAFYTEYKAQLAHALDHTMEIVNGFEDYLWYINPQSLLSATYPTCIEKGADALLCGAERNDTYMMYGFVADVADSLAAIKKYVFQRKELTLAEFKDILDRNFEGHENFRRKLLLDRDKYGNNKDLPDFFAKDVAEFAAGYVCGKPNSPGRKGVWNAGFHVARQSYALAPKTAASPNGRRQGEELSKNLSASMGMNREGATAAILSVTKIDATAFVSDASLDLGLLPSAVKGEDGLAAMLGLLMTFVKRGGHALHINVFDADTLRKAQENPQQYQDLQIRVSGWNVLWNNISRQEQEGFIKQAEALL